MHALLELLRFNRTSNQYLQMSVNTAQCKGVQFVKRAECALSSC